MNIFILELIKGGILRLKKSYLPDKAEQLNVVIGGYGCFGTHVSNVSKILRLPKHWLHFGDLFYATELDLVNYIMINDIRKTNSFRVLNDSSELAEEDKINIKNENNRWFVFYVERGVRQAMSDFDSYEKSIEYVAHCLFASALLVSVEFRNRYFPTAIPLPRLGESWPDGKIRY